MARLSSFHMLCPLIDQSSFLGVVNDSSNDCVVVTLGRNIVIRYKISDRKQVGCWSTREKLTSPVIYDPVGCQYVAVFNRNQIRTWKQNDEDLDNIKKHKFPEEIHCVLACPGTEAEPVVLFRSGRICRLSNFLTNKGNILEVWKHQERSGLNVVLNSDETLEDWHMIHCQTVTYVLVSARSSNINKRFTFYLLKLCDDEKEYSVLRRFSLKLPEAWLVGHTVIQRKDSCALLTLWSNGKIHSISLNLDNTVVDEEDSIENDSEWSRGAELISPGNIIDSVKELLDVEHDVALVALGPDHLALYGADSGGTGAVVYIVDVHSSVTGELPWEALKESAAKQCLKYFDAKEMRPRIWNASGHLFIPSSDGRLVLASYELGPHPPLADLLGCLGKKKIAPRNNGMVHHHSKLENVSWLTVGKPLAHSDNNTSKQTVGTERNFTENDDMPEKVYMKLKILVNEGLPESSICSTIFPSLMEDGDIESINWCMSHFRDIPEANLVDLLCFFLNQKTITTPCKKEDHFLNETIASNPEKKPTSKGSLKQPIMETAVKPMMNGDIHEAMDINSCDSFMEDSEMEGFEVGHTFVKGRRRSLRVMKVNTPQKHSSTPQVNSSTRIVDKRGKNDSQESSDMEVETISSPLKCPDKKNRRNSSLVVNGLDVVEEGVEVTQCKSNSLKKVVEEIVKESVLVSSHNVDDGYIKEEQEGRTFGESLNVESTRRPSLLADEETRIEKMALPYGQRKPVEKLLSVPISSVMLLPSLRSHLPFHLALKLLRHLLWLLSSSEMPVSSNPTEIQLIDWICHLLDAFYQRYTLSQDEEVLETLAAVKEVLDMQLQVIDALKEMEPLLQQLISGKTFEGNTSDKWYSIENIRLY